MLCLNCGQLFPADESEISAEESEQTLKTRDQSVGKTDDG